MFFINTITLSPLNVAKVKRPSKFQNSFHKILKSKELHAKCFPKRICLNGKSLSDKSPCHNFA